MISDLEKATVTHDNILRYGSLIIGKGRRYQDSHDPHWVFEIPLLMPRRKSKSHTINI